MAVWDTKENQRYECTRKTLDSIHKQVDLAKHRLVIVDNGSTHPDTLWRLRGEMDTPGVTVITLPENIGTARAINKAWLMRNPGEHCVKMDNDIVVHEKDWPDLMETVFRKDPSVGICSLKRFDLEERPDHENPWYRSQLRFLPHNRGEPWVVLERVTHCMGTCQGYNSALLDKIGFLYQMGSLYALDDSLAAVRCFVAGFQSVFLPSVPIEHCDNIEPNYTHWKERVAGEFMGRYNEMVKAYQSGTRSIYHGPEDE
jgi:GT2 family glycosyltransferase